MDSILKVIFENFARKHEPQSIRQLNEHISNKTENDVSDSDRVDTAKLNDSTQVNRISHQAAVVATAVNFVENVECTKPKNIMTSVIKFAGRAPSLNIPSITHNQPAHQQTDDTNKTNSINSPVVRDATTQITINTVTPATTDNDLDLTPINYYKPLNYEPFPEIAPLPLLNTNTNLSVYRQLLSPYLKKPANANVAASTATTNVKQQTSVIIDRPPKKMIKKYASLSKQ